MTRGNADKGFELFGGQGEGEGESRRSVGWEFSGGHNWRRLVDPVTSIGDSCVTTWFRYYKAFNTADSGRKLPSRAFYENFPPILRCRGK